MTIRREDGKIIIECDSCPEIHEGEPGDEFETVWSGAKREGFIARKVAGEWLHGCARCGPPT